MAVVVGVLIAACAPSNQSSTAPSSPGAVAPAYALGHFPDAPTDSFSESTEDALQAVLDATELPGVSATVMAADGGVWTGAAGTADGVHPVKPDSQFGIGSITKTVIAAEVTRLAGEGTLRLTDPVSDHLPSSLDFDANGATVENLLAMESGIPDPLLDGPEVETDPLREWEAWEILDSVPPSRSEPGRVFNYGNTNYILLGLVIEETTGTSVASALRAHVLADPGLAALVYQPEERPQGPLALPFYGGQVRPNIAELGGGYLPAKASVSAGGGAGSMASDSASLALWGYLLFGGELLAEQSLQAMTDFGTGEEYDGYGLGTYDFTGRDFGEKAVGNGGWDPGGYSSILIVLPDTGIVISVLTNQSGHPHSLVTPVAEKLASLLER